ncbi:MAG: DUF3147 family protein [Verrucomicrobiota bacterium]
MLYLFKIIISLALIIAVSETTQRFGFWGALLASLPLVSILSMIWIYTDTHDVQKLSTFSIQVFWLVLPSLGLFLSLPWFLARYSFYTSLGLACVVTLVLFASMLGIMRLFDYNLLK